MTQEFRKLPLFIKTISISFADIFSDFFHLAHNLYKKEINSANG